jgi:predicted HicB family RNase H-like nuclease
MSLRIPPELHRRLAFEAAEAGISLSRHLNHKLSATG